MSTPAYKKKARQLEHIKQKQERRYKKLYNSKRKTKTEFKELKPSGKYERKTVEYPSIISKAEAIGSKKESQKYTGDYIIGIATMHKSNLVPVGRGDNPKEYSTMRRN